MARMPPLWDPAKAVDKLPQPYRMIDKILSEIIESSLEICVAKDKQKKVKIAMHIDTVSPSMHPCLHGRTHTQGFWRIDSALTVLFATHV